jgi:hypothetical protein
VSLFKSIVKPEPPPRHASPRQWARVAWPALLVLGLAGCGREGVRVYEAPKDQAAAPSAPDPHAGLDLNPGVVAAAARGSTTSPLQWETPAGWKEQPAGQMRAGFFTVTGEKNQQAEVTIIPLSGRSGSDLDNVNRWLSQLGAPAITSEKLAALSRAVTIAGSEGQLYDLSAPESQSARKRTLAAVLRREGTAWFFKMTGDDALVAAQKPAFVRFLESVRFNGTPAAMAASSPSPAPATSATTLPPAAEDAAPPTPPTPSTGVKPDLDVPATWKALAPGSMQLAKYVPAGAEGKAEVTVAVLPGDGGGTAANVNRWRRQLGLAPWGETEVEGALQKLNVTGAEAYLVDLANPATQKRMLAAGVIRGGQSWFYKLTGDTTTVEAERTAFVRVVEGARYAP